ncbi:flotillin family protein [Chondrinema litorale]|uniref:flotillin family protein n=1 Tax=Chondrinema litorale TaxID=2994555 RepID=UPI0025442B64|nr:flotillin family protein [Chondrinema litorale]UZR94816.1 SPFH domain-containing protein [Chondrinema litorale]
MEIISGLGGILGVFLVLVTAVFVSRYKRSPSNKILVVYGKVGTGKSAKCIHGGGAFVIPVIQDWQYLNLSPIPIEIDLKGALSKQNIRINTPSTFTVGISTKEGIMLNAAERLLGLDEAELRNQALDIILGQLRLVIATLTIEEINQDREQFLSLINKHVASELNKVGLELINVNIKDITDESGYIEAIGKKAAAEAVNLAKVEVAQQERSGSIGEAKANREKDVEVASEYAQSEEGTKAAEAKKRVGIANLEAGAVQGENQSKAKVAEYNAELAEKTAEAQRRSDVANANALKEILEAQKIAEMAKLEKEQIVQKEIEKRKIELDAEAKAEQIRRVAKGDADAILMKYKAEAEGLQQLLKAKAKGYEEIVASCNGDSKAAATLLLLEKLETLVAKQTEAIANLKIDKITVWDSGSGEKGGSTSNFIKNFISTLPPIHELAKQAGIDLPSYLGSVNETPPKPPLMEDLKDVLPKANGSLEPN